MTFCRSALSPHTDLVPCELVAPERLALKNLQFNLKLSILGHGRRKKVYSRKGREMFLFQTTSEGKAVCFHTGKIVQFKKNMSS